MRRSWMIAFALAALGVVASPALARAQAVEASLATAFDRAELDFDAVRQELALGGSAPLPGLEPLTAPMASADPGDGKKAAHPRTAAAQKQDGATRGRTR